jgi:hypothetical protein
MSLAQEKDWVPPFVFARRPRSNYHFNYGILNPTERGTRLRYCISLERH